MPVFYITTKYSTDYKYHEIKYDVKKMNLGYTATPIRNIAEDLYNEIVTFKESGYNHYKYGFSASDCDCMKLFHKEYLKEKLKPSESLQEYCENLINMLGEGLYNKLYEGYVILTVNYEIDDKDYTEKYICKKDYVERYTYDIQERCISQKVIYIDTTYTRTWDKDEDED